MEFMISMFGSETTGRPRARRKVQVSRDPGDPLLDVNGLRGQAAARKADSMAGDPHLPQEEEEGNVEYKLKLVNPSNSRFQHLVTQLKWRLREGQGEAIYEIGVEDCGMCTGLTDREMDASIYTLKMMAHKLKASISTLRERDVDALETPMPVQMYNNSTQQHTYAALKGGPTVRRRVAEVLVRKVPDHQQFLDLRVAVLGCVDAGKSTLLGVLTQGELDNGRGRARLNLFRHLHEVQSGRTSSISLDVLGFDSNGQIINYATNTSEEICEKSTKLVTLIDLAGHQKYLKTTVFGLTGYKPHCVMLVVAANIGLMGTTREHLALATALDLPLFVVVTKIDLVSHAQLNNILLKLDEVIKGPGFHKVPLRVNSEDDTLSVAANFERENIVPIFTVSCVSGKHLAIVQRFLNIFPPTSSAADRKGLIQQRTKFQIDEIYNVPQVGLVAAGLLSCGVIREGDELLVGPNQDGKFATTKVESLHRNKAPCRVIQAGQGASLALGEFKDFCLRKGMVVLCPTIKPIASRIFEAKVCVISHPGDICRGFQATLHCGNICQTVTFAEIVGKRVVKCKEDTIVKLAFVKQPEFVQVGDRILFRTNKTKGIGHISKVALTQSDITDVTRTKTM